MRFLPASITLAKHSRLIFISGEIRLLLIFQTYFIHSFKGYLLGSQLNTENQFGGTSPTSSQSLSFGLWTRISFH
jgi:hypothetical protein